MTTETLDAFLKPYYYYYHRADAKSSQEMAHSAAPRRLYSETRENASGGSYPDTFQFRYSCAQRHCEICNFIPRSQHAALGRNTSLPSVTKAIQHSLEASSTKTRLFTPNARQPNRKRRFYEQRHSSKKACSHRTARSKCELCCAEPAC